MMADNPPGLIISPITSRTSNTPNVMSGNRSALSHPVVLQLLRLIMSITKMTSIINAITQSILTRSTGIEKSPPIDKTNRSNKTDNRTRVARNR